MTFWYKITRCNLFLFFLILFIHLFICWMFERGKKCGEILFPVRRKRTLGGSDFIELCGLDRK